MPVPDPLFKSRGSGHGYGADAGYGDAAAGGNFKKRQAALLDQQNFPKPGKTEKGKNAWRESLTGGKRLVNRSNQKYNKTGSELYQKGGWNDDDP